MLLSLKENKNLRTGIILTLVGAVLIISFSFIVGRNNLFLLLNADLGTAADYFFRFWTNLGDGIVWIAVAVLFFIYRRKYIPLLIAAIVISTLLTQITKNYIVPAEPRPTVAIKETNAIHTVPDVEILTAYSFPSGHTATAFTIFLMGCFFIRKRWIVPIGFLCAILVGYSRVYLAQHFPLDVGGGMVTALLTIIVSIKIQKITHP